MVTFRQPFVGGYKISLDYGEKFEPLYTDESPHRGIDYLTPEGTEILASADGYVSMTAELQAGYGHYIVLTHSEGYQTVYAHLSDIKVRIGQHIAKGQVIALSGNTGNSTGPHLHFEVRRNNLPIDPKSVLQSVFDTDPDTYTPKAETPVFESVREGYCEVVCDVANARCHCDMSRVMGTLKRGDVICIGNEVTMYNGLPYRDYFDAHANCWLRIAEHDPFVQMLRNTERL